jgi:hypothetical protein
MNSPVVTNSKNESRVFVALLIILLFVEMGIRIFETRLSGNINHIFSIPEIARQIDHFDKGPAVVFMGNSLTNNAIDSGLLDELLRNQLANPIQTSKVTPDGTALSDWYCIYHNQLMPLRRPPSHIVIGFAWAQLSDQYPINPTRLGGFFCKASDVGSLSETGLTRHQQFLRFLAGAASHVYVNREAIRNRILDALIPDYQLITQQLNEADAARDTGSSTAEKKYSYQLLQALLQSINRTGSQVILIAMPVVNNYELDEQLIKISAQLQVPLLDMRHVDGLTDTMFEDTIHLNSSGRSKFSKYITEMIAPYLKNNITVTDR